jgi:hypothetical protein
MPVHPRRRGDRIGLLSAGWNARPRTLLRRSRPWSLAPGFLWRWPYDKRWRQQHNFKGCLRDVPVSQVWPRQQHEQQDVRAEDYGQQQAAHAGHTGTHKTALLFLSFVYCDARSQTEVPTAGPAAVVPWRRGVCRPAHDATQNAYGRSNREVALPRPRPASEEAPPRASPSPPLALARPHSMSAAKYGLRTIRKGLMYAHQHRTTSQGAPRSARQSVSGVPRSRRHG